MSEQREIPDSKKTLDDQREQEAADRIAAGLPPDTPVEMSAAQRQYAEKEKASLLAAIAPIPTAKKSPEAQDRRRVDVIIRPVSSKPAIDIKAANDAVNAALAEQARLLQVVNDAKSDLEAANLKVDQAREAVQGATYEHAQAAAVEQIAPFVQQVTAQRNALQAIHDQYGPDLKDYAKSIAAGELVRRSALQARYNAAAPLAQRLARAFKDAEEAIRLLGQATAHGSESLPFSVSAAVTASKTALAHDAKKIREDCAALVAAVTAWRSPGVNVAGGPSEPWRPGMGSGGGDGEIDTNWQK